ncbi:MAG: tripartite tricarboxylate transporter TctB family protein [Pseudomonadota bacterium]
MQVDPRRGDLVIAVLLLALAAFFLWGAWRMPAGTFAVPGPGVVPMILGALLAATALVLFIKALIGDRSEAGVSVAFGVAPIAIVFAALTAVALAFERAGFLVTLSVFMFVMLRAVSRLGTLRSVLVAVGIVLAAGWFFDSVLGVNLPRVPW